MELRLPTKTKGPVAFATEPNVCRPRGRPSNLAERMVNILVHGGLWSSGIGGLLPRKYRVSNMSDFAIAVCTICVAYPLKRLVLRHIVGAVETLPWSEYRRVACDTVRRLWEWMRR